jgi:hypothetical protein
MFCGGNATFDAETYFNASTWFAEPAFFNSTVKIAGGNIAFDLVGRASFVDGKAEIISGGGANFAEGKVTFLGSGSTFDGKVTFKKNVSFDGEVSFNKEKVILTCPI